jgi:hypothetical protein
LVTDAPVVVFNADVVGRVSSHGQTVMNPSATAFELCTVTATAVASAGMPNVPAIGTRTTTSPGTSECGRES